ncbi:MAG: RdgB/HAM1 family non-canonical purine NTP pyrophosphatase [Ruminococcaceae bacterium]|nr:RdgB/HAM1 family non-canonical purine NTP pyrophosphatase [Oscillospiraceae bacterium]
MKMILASNNKKKLIEMQTLLSELGIDVVSQRDAGCDFEVEETGETFEENAYLKASAVTAATGEIAIADDSGLMVDALDGAPGVYSARFTGNHEDTDEQRYLYLLEKLQGEENRAAKFVSSICCTFPNGDILRARGECRGSIAHAPSGNGGFGYDPVFIPENYEQSMAELGADVKNRIAHRGRAIRAFQEELRNYYADK